MEESGVLRNITERGVMTRLVPYSLLYNPVDVTIRMSALDLCTQICRSRLIFRA